MWVVDAGGGEPRQVTDRVGSYVMNPRWSPDGRRIGYSAKLNDTLSLFVTDVTTNATTPLSSEEGHELLVHWSPDGWLYFRALRDDVWQLWRRPVGGGEPERLTETGYTVFGVAGDNLLCWRDDEAGIWRLPVAGGQAQVVVDAETAKEWTSAVAVEGGFYFLGRRDTSARLGYYDLASARAESLAVVPLDSGMLTIAPSGNRLLYDSTSRFEIDLMLADAAP